MQSYDNFGRLISETNTFYVDGKAVTVSTMYNPEQPGRPVQSQTIMSNGSSKTVMGGKILP
jgi:YD repeat-containing protein